MMMKMSNIHSFYASKLDIFLPYSPNLLYHTIYYFIITILEELSDDIIQGEV